MITHLTLVLNLLMVPGSQGLPTGDSGRVAEPGVCRLGMWTDPQPMSGVGTLLRSPSLAAAPGRRLVTGLNVPRADETPLEDAFFLGSDDPGDSLGRPAGNFQFVFPRVATESDGRVHLVWAEPSKPLLTGEDVAFPFLTTLWHASYSEGVWSDPVKLLQAGRIYWGHERSAMHLDHSVGTLTLIVDTFPAGGPGGSATVLVQVASNGDVTIRAVFDRGSPIYMGMSIDDPNIHLAYVDFHPSHRDTRVQVVSSVDNGATWTQPEVLNPDSRLKAGDTWTFVDAGGTVQLLWIENGGDLLFGPTVLHHASKRPDAADWSRSEPYALPGGLGHLEASMDPCGGLHLVGDVIGASSIPTLAYFVRREDGWVRAELPVGGVGSVEPALYADGEGIHLAWSEIHDGSLGQPAGVRVMVASRWVLERQVREHPRRQPRGPGKRARRLSPSRPRLRLTGWPDLFYLGRRPATPRGCPRTAP